MQEIYVEWQTVPCSNFQISVLTVNVKYLKELRTQNSDVRLFVQECLQLHSDCQNIFNKQGQETTTEIKCLLLS